MKAQHREEGRPTKASDNYRGCRELWEFGWLPYADLIFLPYDLMHVVYNVVKMGIKALRKHDTTHPNRTVDEVVLTFEHGRGRFEHVGTNDSSCPWTLSQEEMDLVDDRLRGVRSCEMAQVPLTIYKHLGFKNSYDIMVMACSYARYCLSDLGSPNHTECILTLFDIIKFGCADKFAVQHVADVIMPKLYEAMAEWEGFFPTSECTFAFHQLIHCIAEMPKGGPPCRYWMLHEVCASMLYVI
jgi:hypothetical protein